MTGTTSSSRSLGAIEVGELARPLEPDAGRQSRALGDEPPCAVHVVSDGATMNQIDRVEKWNFVGVVAAEVSEPWGAGAWLNIAHTGDYTPGDIICSIRRRTP